MADLTDIDVSSLGAPQFALTELKPEIEEPVVGPDEDIPFSGPEGKLRREVDRFKTGWQQESSILNMAHYAAEPFFQVEEGFDIADHPELWQDIPEDRRDDIQQSVSLVEAEFRRDKVLQEIETEEEFMAGGFKSAMAYRLAGALLDPTTLAGGVAEFKALHMVSKAGRLTRMATGAAGAAATAAAQMAPQALNRSDVDEEDMIYNMALAAGLGTIAGNFSGVGDEFTAHANSAAEELSRNVTRKMDEILVGTRKADLEAADSAINILGPRLTDDIGEEGAEVALEGSELLTAQSRAIQEHASAEFDRLKLGEEAVTSKLAKAAQKMGLSDFMLAYKMKGKLAKYYAHHILESASGIGASHKSAALMQRLNRTKLLTKVKNWRTSFSEYAESIGVKPWNRAYWGEARTRYNKELYMELAQRAQADKLGRLADYVSEAHPSIIKQADDWQAMMSDALRMGKASGVRGLQDVVELAGYVPLRWVGRKMNNLSTSEVAKYEALLASAYISDGIDDAVAGRIAKAVFRRARTTDMGFDANPGALLSRDSRGMLEDMLRETGFDVEEIADVFRTIDKKVADAGKAGFARKRTSLDLTVSDADGRSLMDIVDIDMPKMAQQYASEMAGRSALARKGIASDADWKALRNAVIEDARANNEYDAVAKLVSSIDGVYNQLLGRPVGKGVAKPARRLKDWTMLTALGQNGFAQAAETASVFASHGVANTFKKVPEMRRLLKGLRAGDDEAAGILAELNVHLGSIWDEHLLMAPNVYLDESTSASGIWSSIDSFSAAAKDKLGYWSGMNQIKKMQQQFTVAMQTDKVFKALQAGDMDDTILRRFSEIGWGEDTLKAFRKQIDNGNVTFQANGAVDRLNLDAWPTNLSEEFALGLHKHTHQIIQSPMVGETAYWMHGTIGSMVTQFRSFPIAAMEKQLVRHGRIADGEAMAIINYGLACSSAVTMARAALYDATSPDEKSKMEQLLTPAGLTSGAMRYASVFGFLPDALSIAGSMTGFDALTGSSRRGFDQASDVTPALGAAVRAGKAVRGLAQVATFQRGLERRDIRNIFGSVWLGNTLQMQQFSNLIQATLDE